MPDGFDKTMLPVLKVFWFCLHLPRTLLDTIVLTSAEIYNHRHLDGSHAIVPVPIQLAFTDDVIQRIKRSQPAVLFVPNAHAAVAAQLRLRVTTLEPIPFSALTPETAARLWRELGSLYGPRRQYQRLVQPPIANEDLLLAPARLPTQFMTRHLAVEQSYVDQKKDRAEHLIPQSMHFRFVWAAIAELENKKTPEKEAELLMPETLRSTERTFKIPVVLGSLGVANAYVLAARRSGKQTRSRALESPPNFQTLKAEMNDEEVERAALSCVMTTRACATEGIGVVLPPIPSKAFGLLDTLERHYALNRPNPKALWRVLRDISSALRPLFDDAIWHLLKKASVVTAFTNFSIGLVTPPGASSPLCTIMPCSYFPTMPMTRTFQMIPTRLPMIYLKAGLRVLVAECVARKDPIATASRRASRMLADNLADTPGVSVDIVECNSVTISTEHSRRHHLKSSY
jgi:hypothetical protein